MDDPINDAAAGTTETKWEREQSPQEFVRFWLERIDLAMKAEDEYRKRAKANNERYTNEQRVQATASASAGKTQRKFNIFYTNVETIVPAVINSAPVPDVRRRFGDSDAAGKIVSQVLERALTVSMDQFQADQVFRAVEKDNELTGRGIPRLRYEDVNGQQRVWLEVVDWRDFVRGPAKNWADIPFVAFREYLTREQLMQISPKLGGLVGMDAAESGADEKDKSRTDGRNMGDAMKRACVWQIWDKERREMVQIATGYKDGPLAIIPDPLQLEGFFPIPEALYAIKRANDLNPIDPLRQYEDQADELDDITQRLTKLVKAARWRGISNVGTADALGRLKDASDGEIIPSGNAQEFREGEIAKAVWMMPVADLVALIEKLYNAREEVKRTIFEVTGVADIMRGDTQASETATAQRIKAQWGSLRIQQRQADMQRLCRDCMRMMAEVICQFFTPETIKAMTGIDLAPSPAMPQMQAAMAMLPPGAPPPPDVMQMMEAEQVKGEVLQILKSDALRTYRVDIETDSTIRADLARAQENHGTFITGLGKFFQAVAPAVQAGAMPLSIAVKIVTGMARSFKLGRQAEDALDEWGKMVEANPAMGMSPPMPAQPQPGAQPGQPPQPGGPALPPTAPNTGQTAGQAVSPMPQMVQ